ncbi:MAG: helix-turn-helix domain-containing protein [Noviherbaspirillum sp.]
MIRTLADFDTWINGPVKAYFPHEVMIYAIGSLLGEQIRVRHLFGVNYPSACLDRFERITNCSERRVVQRWLSQYRAQIVNAGDMPAKLSPQEQNEARTFGLTNLAAFGCLDADGKGGTYFSFGQIPGGVSSRHAYKLELLLPYLHQTLIRILHQSGDRLNEPAQPGAQLTKRERQILSLVATGMSNRAIAEKLSRSELTVQNHVHAIF